MIRQTVIRLIAIVLMLSGAALAGAPPILTQQGRLLDAAGAPLTGTYTITFSYHDNLGNELGSEVHIVDVVDGLYAVMLSGMPDSALSLPEVWLGVKVGSDPQLMPRLRLVSVPFALSSKRVDGDVTTSPGSLRVGYPFDPDIRERVTSILSDSAGTGVSVLDSAKATSAKAKGIIVVRGSTGVGTSGRASLELDNDDDGDGASETEAEMSVGGSTVTVRGTMSVGGDPSTKSTAGFESSSNQARLHCGAGDTNLDGITDWEIGDWAISNGSVWEKMRIDALGDGHDEISVVDSCTPTDAVLVRAVDSDNNGENENWDFQRVSSGQVTHLQAADLDQDGLEDLYIWEKVDNTDLSVTQECVAPNPYGGSSNEKHVSSIESRQTIKSHFENGDAPTQEQRVASTGASSTVTFTGPAGSSSTSMTAGPVGRGGMQVSMNDGFSRASASLATSPSGVEHTLVWDAAADGVADYSTSSNVSSSSGFIRIRDTDANRLDATVDGSGTTISVVPPSAGTYEFELVVSDDNGVQSMRNGSGAIALQLDGDGRIGIGQAADATNPVHHSSGAHLTVGGDWTNASDENLKENFESVDSEEILDKVAELPISKWNYKNEGEDVRHIGPTAQDFKSTFGLGADDKSISTIDPSGIALAAIKELIKQNAELRQRLEKLEKEAKAATK